MYVQYASIVYIAFIKFSHKLLFLSRMLAISNCIEVSATIALEDVLSNPSS